MAGHTHKGHPQSAATRARISKALKGKKHPHRGHAQSAATRAKISAALRGKHRKAALKKRAASKRPKSTRPKSTRPKKIGGGNAVRPKVIKATKPRPPAKAKSKSKSKSQRPAVPKKTTTVVARQAALSQAGTHPGRKLRGLKVRTRRFGQHRLQVRQSIIGIRWGKATAHGSQVRSAKFALRRPRNL